MRKKYKIGSVKPRSDDFSSELKFVRKWQLSNQLIDEVLVFDLKNNDLLDKIWTRRDKLTFCLSSIVIPKEFKLINAIVKIGDTIDDPQIKEMASNSIPFNGSANQYLYFMYEINERPSIDHPCLQGPITGSKACAYHVASASSETTNLESIFLLFYAEHTSGKVISKLKDLFSKLPASPPYQEPEECEWEKLYIVPLMLPDSTIFYWVVPSTKAGRNYLLTALNQVKEDSWFGIDHTFELLDEWETIVTLDVTVACTT